MSPRDGFISDSVVRDRVNRRETGMESNNSGNDRIKTVVVGDTTRSLLGP